MLQITLLVASLALADSVNPVTIALGLYLASGERPRTRLAEFTLSVFAVSLAGGALIALGPGQLIRHALPDLDLLHTVRYIGEIVAGVLLLAGGALIWRRRHRLVARGMPAAGPQRKSSLLLGATIIVLEFPTAFPYFAAIAAILGSGLGPARELVLLLVFNVFFVLPLIGILLTLVFAGDGGGRVLTRWRDYLDRRWPHILSVLILIVGVLAVLFGATGLASGIHGGVGGFFRHMRRRLHLHF